MLEKMGWKKGEGLGKEGTGMKNPVRSFQQLEVSERHVCFSIERNSILIHFSLSFLNRLN